MNAGLYVYDFSRLLDGFVEVHWLRDALVGANDFIDFDMTTQTIAFIRNYQAESMGARKDKGRSNRRRTRLQEMQVLGLRHCS